MLHNAHVGQACCGWRASPTALRGAAGGTALASEEVMGSGHAIAARTAALGLAGAVVAPLAWLARAMLPSPVLPHAVAAPRRILGSSVGRVSYYEEGSVSGTPAVLLHDVGPAGCAYELRAVFDALRVERPVVAADLPGYGFSERRAEPLDREGYARFVEELVADVAVRHGSPVDVVAVGTTCELAALAALRCRSLLRSLVLVGPTGFGSRSGVFAGAVSAGQRALGHALALPVVRPLVHRAITSKPVLRATLARRATASPEARLVEYAHASAQQPCACAAPVAALFGQLSDRYVAADVYEQLTIPLCFVHGDATRAPIEALVGERPSLRAVHVPGGARPHLENPEATTDAMRAFWRSILRRPALRLIRGGAVSPPRGSARAARMGREGKRWT